jgi:hypothetical protein
VACLAWLLNLDFAGSPGIEKPATEFKGTVDIVPRFGAVADIQTVLVATVDSPGE